MTRKFEVTFIGTATITLNERVIDRVDDEWRSQLYDLNTPEEIVEHIAYNLFINRWPLSSLDGWADMPDDYADGSIEWDTEGTTTEIVIEG